MEIQLRVLSVLRVLTEPDRVFRDLADGPPRLGFAYGILVVHGVVTNVLSGVMVLYGGSPALEPSRELLEQAGIEEATLLSVLALCAPITALATWGITWLVVRIGAGTSRRLWETAAWSQVPNLVLVPFVGLLGTASLSASTALSCVAILWCARVVQSGVRELSEGSGTRAAVIYAVIWIGWLLLSLASTQGGSSGTYV